MRAVAQHPHTDLVLQLVVPMVYLLLQVLMVLVLQPHIQMEQAAQLQGMDLVLQLVALMVPHIQVVRTVLDRVPAIQTHTVHHRVTDQVDTVHHRLKTATQSFIAKPLAFSVLLSLPLD